MPSSSPPPPPAPASGAGPEDPSRLEPGTWIGRYQVEALLGSGGMGAVYQVRDSVLERSVALKAIRIDPSDDGAARDRFRREAKALAQLNHRHVCQVYDWLEWGSSAFIAMELIQGRPLREAAPAMDGGAKLRTLRAIAEALDAAHAKGIVHRDLKPMNVMVDEGDRVKVVDFGLARLLDPGDPGPGAFPGPEREPFLDPGAKPEATSVRPPELDQPTLAQRTSQDSRRTGSGGGQDSLTQAGSFMGSPAYASPEQMARLEVGPPSDIFSLGIVAWELLLGDAPFPGKGSERMAATMAGKRQSLQGRKLSSRLKALLGGMLERDPAARPSARRVAEVLGRELRPFPVARAAAAAAGLALILGSAYLAFGRGVIADLVKDHPPRLVVLPIRNGTGEAALRPLAEVGMTELMAAALRDSPSLQVVDQESVARALATLRLDADRPLTQGQLLQLLQILGAPLVLEGSLERIPGTGALRYAFALRAPGGRARHQGETRLAAGLPPAPYALVEPAARELLRKVDPLGRTPEHGAPAPPEAFAAYAQGKALFMKGDFQASEPLLREAALKAPAFSQAVTAYASCLRRLGREPALLVSHWAVMAARTTGDRWAEVRALGVQAFLARDRGDLAEAERLRRTTLALARASRDPDGAAVALNHLGLLAGERGRDGEAQAYFEQSLALARQLADQTNLTLAQNNLANLALKRGDLEAATTRYQEALAGQTRMGNRAGEAMTLNNLGVVALTRGHLGQARACLDRALALREAAGDQAGRATSLRNLGILELMQGNLDESEARLRKALEAARTSGILAIEAECRFCLADLLRLRQHLHPALEEYARVAELLKAGVTPQVRAAAQAGAAECEARLHSGALKEAGKRLEGLDAENRRSPYTLRAWAWVHWLSGRPRQALESLDRALADPSRSAPEIKGELRALRKRFAAAPGA